MRQPTHVASSRDDNKWVEVCSAAQWVFPEMNKDLSSLFCRNGSHWGPRDISSSKEVLCRGAHTRGI